MKLNYPLECQLIEQCIHSDPTLRPSALELLENRLFEMPCFYDMTSQPSPRASYFHGRRMSAVSIELPQDYAIDLNERKDSSTFSVLEVPHSTRLSVSSNGTTALSGSFSGYPMSPCGLKSHSVPPIITSPLYDMNSDPLHKIRKLEHDVQQLTERLAASHVREHHLQCELETLLETSRSEEELTSRSRPIPIPMKK